MEKRKKIEKSETNRGKEHIIINNMDKYNFSKTKDNSKVYRCIEYKTSNKCKNLIIFIIIKEKKIFLIIKF